MTAPRLKRELGLGGAVVTGLGSILGTGAFVSIGVASAMWGDLVLAAVPVAALVAVSSGLSSAYLAGRFPVAGGTYEYAYETLGPKLGFTAGWLFLLAKTASAATAALGVGLGLGVEGPVAPLAIVIAVTLLVLTGVRRGALANTVLVAISVTGIVWFLVSAVGAPSTRAFTWGDFSPGRFLGTVAFLFVAYTGYGRVATLGEEVRDPARVVPIAVVSTLVIASLLYMAIAVGGRLLAGPFWGESMSLPTLDDPVVRVAALSAMLGVMVNLILGLSRVWLAMGRRGDMPTALSRLDRRRQPRLAVMVAGTLVAATTLVGDIRLAWSFSAMTVLLYYGLTNLSALKLDRGRGTAWIGLASCLLLSVFVVPAVWLIGAGLIGLGLIWKTWPRRMP
jgi:APA family basic amino acid/polyamine antiporter